MNSLAHFAPVILRFWFCLLTRNERLAYYQPHGVVVRLSKSIVESTKCRT